MQVLPDFVAQFTGWVCRVGEVEGWEEHKQDTKQKEKEQFMRVLCVNEASNLKSVHAGIYMDHICHH